MAVGTKWDISGRPLLQYRGRSCNVRDLCERTGSHGGQRYFITAFTCKTIHNIRERDEDQCKNGREDGDKHVKVFDDGQGIDCHNKVARWWYIHVIPNLDFAVTEAAWRPRTVAGAEPIYRCCESLCLALTRRWYSSRASLEKLFIIWNVTCCPGAAQVTPSAARKARRSIPQKRGNDIPTQGL